MVFEGSNSGVFEHSGELSRNGGHVRVESAEKGGPSEHVEKSSNGGITESAKKKRSKRQWLILIILGFGNFCVASSVSLQGPFYPREAENKGLTPTQYGIVFSLFQLTVFIFAPFCGKIVSAIGPKFMLTSGLFLVGSACFLFGFLTMGPDGGPFLGLSLATRAAEGLGTAAFTTAMFTIVAAEFPGAVATTYSIMQTNFGVGLIVGPTIGGALYQAGGFILPFVAVGTLILICDVLIFFLLPDPESVNPSGKKTGDLLKFWGNFGLLLDGYCIFSTFLCIGFNITVLEPHIREFNLTPFVVGLVFVISGSIYAITAPIWGRIADKTTKTKPLAIIGCLFLIAFLLLFGPAPFFPVETELWMVILSLVLFGFGTGGTIVNPFIGALRDTIKRGFPNDLTTYGLVSSLFTSSNSMGAFIGPTLAGWLVERIGFRAGTMVLLGNEVLLVFLLILYSVLKRDPSGEKEPLLQKERPVSSFKETSLEQ